MDLLKPVVIDRPADAVFSQLRQLIVSGHWQPGERLASERQLAERFGLNRVHVREALQKLEFFGMIRTHRNVGAVVTQGGIRAVEGIFTDVLALSGEETAALVEARNVLEGQIVELAAVRATPAQLDALDATHRAFVTEVDDGGDGLELDLTFHLQMADAAGNPILRALLGMLAPDVIKLARASKECAGSRAVDAAAEHLAILKALNARDPAAAREAICHHLDMSRPG